MALSSEDDFRWLLSDKARPYLERAGSESGELVALAGALRKELSTSRVHLVLQQIELRQHAHVKFDRADRMFFTRTLLEQATEERIAKYKASRFAAGCSMADVCCGLGGDMIGFAARTTCHGVDRDPIAALLAAANCEAYGVMPAKALVAGAADVDMSKFDAWHIDPDRRTGGKRTTQVEQFEPSPEAIERLLAQQPNAAVKLAPATTVGDAWQADAEIEWIGSRRECRQQVGWFGNLAKQPGLRRATVVHANGESHTITGEPDPGGPNDKSMSSEQIGRFVLEPHAAVLAARLSGAVCLRHDLRVIASGAGYLTSDTQCDDPLVSCFEVQDVLPFDLRRLRETLRERQMAELEIKVRGMKLDPDELRRALLKKTHGDKRLTLLIMGSASNARAVLASRPDLSKTGHERPGRSAAGR